MPVFEFKGRSYEGGGITNGVRTAPSRQAVAAMLRNENILPLQISEKRESAKVGLSR